MTERHKFYVLRVGAKWEKRPFLEIHCEKSGITWDERGLTFAQAMKLIDKWNSASKRSGKCAMNMNFGNSCCTCNVNAL